MKYLKESLKNTWDFLVKTNVYFRDVLLMHGFILFVIIPLLSSSTKFILKQGQIHYLSYDNLAEIAMQHPVVTCLLVLILLLILLLVFFEFTFLLLSVYFIEKKQPVSLKQLLRMTTIQLKKLRPSIFLFFLFYFLLILPIGGLSFNSDLLARIKIPAFIMDFIFTNRLLIITGFILCYLILMYIGIRLIFALPEMILRDRPFKDAFKESLVITKRRFLAIIGRFVFIGGAILLLTGLSFTLVVGIQAFIEQFSPDHALISAVFAMTLLQFFLLVNLVLSTVGIFYIIIDFMNDEGFLPEIPNWFYQEALPNPRFEGLKNTLLILIAVFFGVGVSLYNMDYLDQEITKIPITISHRGVNNNNGVQNSLAALEKTSQTQHPDYIEMDVQMTTDKQFVVIHDFNLKNLGNVNQSPEKMTLAEIQNVTLHEHNQTAKIPTFDSYLAQAKHLNQKLLVEIKTQQKNTAPIIHTFLQKYQEEIQANGHMVQSLSFSIVEALKTQAPHLTVGYILPFNVVGPPITKADFLTMEYSTINHNFITSAEEDGKKVFVWTPNSSDDMSRMIFYEVDGIITDQMGKLNQTIKDAQNKVTYSDKLLNFVIGVG
ncbi:glycerophosphoryl diester phosphodiesterase [Enterococcus saigonensis]|uniref:Glycerophosphoryl diester phosphodiesterase n=1 Tax=Enterococcus saigonensis TaxID=1805431 RepID=A0A679ICZ3_9ENTE|nr:glycerophosphodiester phosphodiesterase [Enterococcus saigonensis]BCA86089.1 glycerophosphoryl diester phosphodiesterase [Enterococcus saigonensis]